jgi:pimeloyl-ACP methyl ester carboxylesterase
MPIADGLYYARFEGGKSAKKPVVLIHGAGSSHLIWPAELRRLPGRTVLAIDLPGHGRSAGIGLQSVEAYSAAVLSFLAELGLYQAVFVGHSLGGAVALQLAADFPQHVAGLGLISSAAYFNVPAELLGDLSSAYTYPAALQFLQKRSFAAAASPALIERSAAALSAARASVLCGDWKACAQFDLRERVGRIRAPAYVACGQEDQLTPPAHSRYLAAQIPSATLEILPDAGHMIILEQPRRLADGLMEFLARVDREVDRIPLPIRLPANKAPSPRLADGESGKEH